MNLQIGLLGPLELRRDGISVNPGGPTQRAVLAMLALHANEPVGVGQLLDGIWGDTDESGAGTGALWSQVSRLRALLDGGTRQSLLRVRGGYRLVADGVSVDAREFEQLLGTARQQVSAGDMAAASRTLDAAMALWRGPALLDLRDFPFAASAAARFEEERAEAAEERVEARLRLGEDATLIPELQALIADQPFRERLHGQLMIALYRAGQQAAALDAYRTARTRLALELGVEPGPELEELHRAILEQREALAPPGMPAVAQRAGTPAARARRRLPPPPVLFGRDRQLAELEALAAETHLITLTGTGGAGKTSLALALLERLEARFDGAALVDLGAQATPERVLPAIASALGLSQQAGPPAEQLADYLADHRMLVLLDSAEHALDAVADIAPLVDATRGLIVATSRQPLRLRGEFVVEVPPLPVPDAGVAPTEVRAEPSTQLFLHAASAAGGEVGGSDDEIAAVGEICRAVDGLPLAIEISAVQTRTEGVAELAATLTQRLPGLPSRSLDVPARQHTMDSAIGWSIDRLARGQLDDLARLSAFAGSFTTSAASGVLDRPAPATLQVLAELLDASLLMRRPSIAGQARFRMLEPVREVVRTRASPEVLAESLARRAVFIRSDVDRLSPSSTGIQRPADLALLRAEHHDLMGALRHLASADPDACVDLAQQLDDYWQWTGQELDAAHVVDEVLGGDRLSTGARCIALGISAIGAFHSGRLDAVLELRDRMCELASQHTDDALLARVCLYDAEFCKVAGEEARGVEAGHAAVRHARRAGPRRTLARAMASLALFESPSSDDRIAWLDEAQTMVNAASMGYTEVWVASSRAIVLEGLGRIPEAIGVYRSVLDLARRFDAPEAVTLPAANLASELLRTWSIDEARTVLLSALHTADQAGHRIWASVAIQELGEAEAARGRWSLALALLVAARALVERMGMAALYSPGELERLDRVERWLGELLGEGRAAAVVARAARMSYREAVTFAADATPTVDATGDVPMPPAQAPAAVPDPATPLVSIGSAVGATSGAGAPSSR